MYRTIIIPVNGTGRSERVLPVAVRLARASGAALELVRVFTHEPKDGEDRAVSRLRATVRDDFAALAEEMSNDVGLPVEFSLLDMPVLPSLQAFVAGRPNPLVVMATHGRVGVPRALLGSVSDGLVRSGVAPVLALRDSVTVNRLPSWQRQTGPFQMIVVPLDGTALAEAGLPHAIELATLTGARIHLVRVVAPLMVPTELGSGVAMQPLPSFCDAMLSRQALAGDYLEAVVRRIRAVNPRQQVSTETALNGAAPPAIVESCRRHGADLVVMATHGRGPSRVLVRAVADRVMRDGTDAILLVRPSGVEVRRSVSAARREAQSGEPVGAV